VDVTTHRCEFVELVRSDGLLLNSIRRGHKSAKFAVEASEMSPGFSKAMAVAISHRDGVRDGKQSCDGRQSD